MCLYKIEDTEYYPEATGIGYVVRTLTVSSLYNRNGIHYELNHEYEACMEPIRALAGVYVSGFHIFEKFEDAQSYRIHQDRIFKVGWRYQLARGLNVTQGSPLFGPCVVARFITHLQELDPQTGLPLGGAGGLEGGGNEDQGDG